MAPVNYYSPGGTTSHNKTYALHSLSLLHPLAVVRDELNRGGKDAATSDKQDVICKCFANL